MRIFNIFEDFNKLYNKEDLNPHIGVGAIIRNEQNQILMLDHVKFNCWTIPIGKGRLNEPPENALRVEMSEELNIQINDFKLVHTFTKPYDRNGVKLTITGYIYLVTSYSGKLKNNEPTKHRSFKWMDISEIKRLKHTTDNTKEMLKILPKL